MPCGLERGEESESRHPHQSKGVLHELEAAAGIEAAKALAGRKRMPAIVFSVVVAVVGLYVTARGLAASR
jgi:hypothetical protein